MSAFVKFAKGIASQYVDIIDWSRQTKCTSSAQVKENSKFYTVKPQLMHEQHLFEDRLLKSGSHVTEQKMEQNRLCSASQNRKVEPWGFEGGKSKKQQQQ